MNTRAFSGYLELLRRYGKSLNLSSEAVLAEPQKHLAAAQAYGEVLPPGAEVLDVGSGGGLPGIPLAISRPDLRLVLAESRARRAAFLELVVAQLGLKNVRVYNGDVRQWRGSAQYVLAQAVASFSGVYQMVRAAAKYPLVIVSRKGPGWQQEVLGLPGAQVFHVKQLDQDAWLVAIRLEGPA